MNTRKCLISSIALVACTGGLATSASGGTAYDARSDEKRQAIVGHHQPRAFADFSDDALWRHLDKTSRRTAIVGLKAPRASEGVRDGKVIIGRAWKRAKDAVLGQRGVKLLAADDLRPNVTVRFRDQSAMAAVRDLHYVQFVEPRSFRGELLTPGGGCNGNNYDWNQVNGGDAYTGTPDKIALPGTSTHDLFPKNVRQSKVPEAWARGATGRYAWVAVIDTGLFSTQEQVQPAGFKETADRHLRQWDVSGTGNLYDVCNHGTRMASNIAAPRDGLNMVGVAYDASLVSIKHGNDVAVDAFESDKVTSAIRAAGNSARIVAMALGTGGYQMENIKQEIQYWSQRGVLFIGAAGTTYCAEGVTYPARMPEVVAVTGATSSGALHPESCGGPEVDLGVIVDDSFAAGRRAADLITQGGSSGATAIAAGVAALIDSALPRCDATLDCKIRKTQQVRERLLNSATPASDWRLGRGLINAYKAIGGFAGLFISGAAEVDAYTSYTLTAKPQGDGPYSYRWSTGATTPSISIRAGAGGTSKTHSVTVTDLTENKSMTASKTVFAVEPPPPDDGCVPEPGYYCP